MITDHEIIHLFLQRNEEAVTQCEARYGSYCFTVAANILKNSSDAEECVNSTWYKAWNSIPPDTPHHLRQYLSTITRNTAFDVYKKIHREKRGGGNMALVLDELEECIAAPSDVEKEYEKKELGQTVNRFVKSLPQPARSVFVRRYYFADPVREIALKYGMSENSINVLLHRTRKKLRKELVKEGYQYE